MSSRLAVLALFFLLSLPQLASAVLPDGRVHGNQISTIRRYANPLEDPDSEPVDAPPLYSLNGTELPPSDTVYYFDQLIDHTNPNSGTFKQRYYFSYQYWEEGGPVVLTTAGETSIDGYDGDLFNTSMVGKIAQENKGSAIVLEHRFFGESNPFANLSTASLQYLTLQQAIDDLEYFATNVALPMPNGTEQTPDKVPWVMIGGSYPGALTAWAMKNKPGLFWAGYASSAPVQPLYDFWQYFEPIRLYMPPSCAADVEEVINYVDQTLNGTDSAAISQLLATFGLTGLRSDDAAAALRNDLFSWQDLAPPAVDGDTFVDFCEAISPGSWNQTSGSGQGLTSALAAWANWFKEETVPSICEGLPASECFDSYNANYSDISVGNAERSWQWLVCTDLGVWRSGTPEGNPTLVSRLVTPDYDLRSCSQLFPEQFPSKQTQPSTNGTIQMYGGWDMQVDRLYFANGLRDPWRYATVSAPSADATKNPNTPIGVGGGYHCSEMIWEYGDVDPTIRAVQDAILSNMTSWIPQYKPGVYKLSNATDSPVVIPQTNNPQVSKSSQHSGGMVFRPSVGAGLVAAIILSLL